MTFQWEPFRACVEEALPLMRRHWDEIERDGAFDPDWDRLFGFAAEGRFPFFTVRRGGALVGYLAFIIHRELLCPRHVVAESVAFWLNPIDRGGWTGVNLFRRAEPGLLKAGVHEICLSPRVDFCNDRGQTVGVILERLGYRPIQVRYSKRAGYDHVPRQRQHDQHSRH